MIYDEDPRHKRFIILVDAMGNDDDNAHDLWIYEALKDCKDVPQDNILSSYWFLDASKTCVNQKLI